MGYVEDDIAQLRAEVERLTNQNMLREQQDHEALEALSAEVERLGINELDCKTLRAENERLVEEGEHCAKMWQQNNDELRADNKRLVEEVERRNDLAQHREWAYEQGWKAGQAAMRERCAKIAEDCPCEDGIPANRSIAAAIRGSK